MKTFSTLFVLAFITTQAFGQGFTLNNYQISSFKNESRVNEAIATLGELADTTRIDTLHEIGKFYLYKAGYLENKRFDLAAKYFLEAVRLSDSHYSSSSRTRCESLMFLGDSYILSNRVNEGEKLYQTVIGIFKQAGNVEGEAHACYRLSNNLMRDLFARRGDIISVANILERSKQLYHELENQKAEIYCGILKVYLCLRIPLERANMVIYLKSLEEISLVNDQYFLPKIYYYLAWVSRYDGNLPGALTYSHKALDAARQSGDTTGIDGYYGEIALAYGDLGRSEESILYYSKCFTRRQQINVNHFTLNRTAVLMTGEMIKLHRFNESLELLKSLQRQQASSALLDKAILEHGIANCLAASGQIKLAEQYYSSMILKYEAYMGDGEARLTGHVDFTKFLIAQKQFNKAATYHDQLEFQSVSTTIARRSEVEHLLFKIDSSQAKFPEAIRHYEAYKKLNDFVFNEIKSGQIEEMNARFKSDQKDKNIALLKQEAQLHEASLKQSAIQRNSLLAGTVMLGLLLSVLYSRYRLKLKSNQLLEKQQEEITRKNFAQQLLINEKDWLVREIHHRVKNNFHMVVGLMGTQASYLKNNEALQALEDSKHRINTMSLIHQKLYQSENLSATSMADYFHELVSYLKDSFNIHNILFVVECEPISLELSYSLPIGLIVNEAVTNSIKYAFPENQKGTVTISLHHTSPEEIQLIISDTGVGISDLENSAQTTSMGMNLMRGLTDDISGTFRIRNQSGTVIQIDFPDDSAK